MVLAPASSTEATLAGDKLASVIAREIERDLVPRRVPVGTVIGSEADLLRRFGVSRAVFREAVRIVEHHGIASMRRGPGGGLVVTAPDWRGVVTAAAIWFSYVGVTMEEISEARIPLHTTACGLLSERIDEEGVAQLREMLDTVEQSGRIHEGTFVEIDLAIVGLCGNPAIQLFAPALADMAVSRLRGTGARVEPPITTDDAMIHLGGYRRLVEAIIRGDAGEAQARIQRLLEGARLRVRDRPLRPRRRAQPIPPGPGKLAERLAVAMRDDIERAGWPVGDQIGSESDLLARYGVSRAVFREAVRILEHHGAVRTKRGPGGGLMVTEPDGATVRRAAELALEFADVTPAQLLEARHPLELACVRLAAERCTEHTAAGLRDALEAERVADNQRAAFHEVHRHVARASGNRPLALFIDVLADLTDFRIPAVRRSRKTLARIAADVRHAHSRIVEAVVDGDVALAQHRMSRHLEATVAALR